MNELTCREVEELLPGYAADALEDQEGCSVGTHLAECRNHDRDLRLLRAGFEHLAITVAPVEPPSVLRDNVLAAFDRAVAEPEQRAASMPVRRKDAGTWRRSGGWLGYALAAALLVVAVVLGAWGLSRGGGGSNVLVRTTNEGDSRLQLIYVESQQTAVLDVALPPLPAGRVYQAWQIAAGPESLGVLDTATGPTAFTADLSGASAVALTVEPTGGSLAPTTEPILVTSLDKG